jgi:large subunit ribosomal protein L28
MPIPSAKRPRTASFVDSDDDALPFATQPLPNAEADDDSSYEGLEETAEGEFSELEEEQSGSESRSSSDAESATSESDSADSGELHAAMTDMLNNRRFLTQFARRLSRVKTLDATIYSKSVVKVWGVYQQHDYDTPHIGSKQAKGHGSGFIVRYGGKLFVMSNAHVVVDALYLTVKFGDEATLYKATAKVIDNDCDLSIIEVESPEFWSKVRPLELSLGTPQKLDQILRIGFPRGGEEMCITEGSINRIEVGEYCHSDVALLQYQIGAFQNPGNSGGPAINRKHEVIGVSFQSDTAGAGLFFTIPVQVIRRFLDAVIKAQDTQQPYQGFPDLAFHYQELEHKETRHAVGADDSGIGVLIRYVSPLCSSADVLKEGDILLALDGTPIKNDASIETDFDKHVDMSYLYSMRHIGDTVVATVIRDGSKLELPIKLKNRAKTTELVAPTEYDKAPTFFIYCGVIFIPATQNAIKDEDIEESVGDDLQGLVALHKKKPGQEIVLINAVLHNKYTENALELRNTIVREVNGIKIDNLRHLIEIIERSDKPRIVIKDNQNRILGLPRISVQEGLTLLSPHHVFKDRSDDLCQPPVYKPGCPEYYQQQEQLQATSSQTARLTA